MNTSLAKRLIGGLFIGVVGLFAGVANAQDIQFSQFHASSLYLNPAYAGIETSPTLNTNFRTQWRAVNTPFLTTQVSGIFPFIGGVDGSTQKGGVGVSFFNDQAGDGSLTKRGILATGAYTLDMRLHKIAAGIQVGVVQTGLDLNAQTWGAGYEQYTGYRNSYTAVSDPGLVNMLSSKAYLLTNLGVMYSYNPGRSYYSSGIGGHIGASGYNLNQPNISLNDSKEYKLPARVNLYGGLDFFLSEDVKFSPNFLLSNQGGFTQVNAGAYFTFGIVPDNGTFLAGTDLILGGWYRLQDAAILSLGLSNSAYTFGLSYDFNTSQYNTFINNRGALEASFAIRLVKENKRKRFDTPRI